MGWGVMHHVYYCLKKLLAIIAFSRKEFLI